MNQGRTPTLSSIEDDNTNKSFSYSFSVYDAFFASLCTNVRTKPGLFSIRIFSSSPEKQVRDCYPLISFKCFQKIKSTKIVTEEYYTTFHTVIAV